MKYHKNVNYLKSLKILCVEDDYIISEQISLILSKYCDNFILASNGFEGINQYNTCDPDIIITDIHMPIMDGLSMIREIRETDTNTPIILITGHEKNQDILNSINLGIDGFINKPIDPTFFLNVVNKISNYIHNEKELKASIELTKNNKIELEKQKKELELIIEGSQVCTWSLNLLTYKIEVNDKFYILTGYQPNEIQINLKILYSIIHIDDIVSFKEIIKNHFTGKSNSIECEFRIYHKTGKIIWVRVQGQVLLRNSQGTASNAFGIISDITKEKEYYSKIIESEEESNAIFQNFLDILFVVNEDLKIVRINKATCSTLGYKYEEILMQPVSILFHNDEFVINNHFKNGFLKSNRNIELDCRHKNGSSIPMSFNISPLSNEKYHISGAIAGAKDVSELRFTLNEIERHKSYIENLITMLPIGVLIVNKSFEFSRANNKYFEIISKCSKKIKLPQDKIYKNIVNQIKTNKHQAENFDIKIIHDNIEIYFQCKIAILFCNEINIDSDNNFYIITISDVTREVTIEREKNLLALVIKQFQSPIYIADTNGLIIFANESAYNKTKKKNRLLKTSLFENIINKNQKLVIKNIKKSLKETGFWIGSNKYKYKINQFREEEISIFLIKSDVSNTSYIVAFINDVTEISQLQRQLALAQKLEAIGQLASGIAHEINSPIQYVINNMAFIQNAYNDLHPLLIEINKSIHFNFSSKYIEILKNIKLNFYLEEIPQSIDEAFDGINRVATIISALRKFSHPGDGEKVITDLNETLENTLIVCRHEWKYAAELITDYAPNLPGVPCYPDLINQVFLNLIINASHAIETVKENDPDSHHFITVRTRLQDEHVEISVSDTGSGIPKKLYSRIFEPFFTTKSVGKGTGQGLAIVHDIIVQKHGGRIDFISQEGRGTTFFVYLPIRPQDKISN